MRISHIVALVGVIVVGFVLKALVFPVGKVAADVRPTVAMDIMQIQRHTTGSLSAPTMRDMTFVFDDSAR